MYVWGNVNAGDKAITKGTVTSLRHCYPHSEISVVSMFPRTSAQFEASSNYIRNQFPDITVLPSLPLVSRDGSLFIRALRTVLLACGLFCTPLLKRLCRSSPLLFAFEQADMVLLNAGHLLFWSDRMGQKRRILRSFILPLVVARRLGKPYGLHAQSFGPFEFSQGGYVLRRLFHYVLSKADYVSVRDSRSLTELEACFTRREIGRIAVVLDPAFYLGGRDESAASAILQNHGLERNGFLAMTVRLSRRGSYDRLPAEVAASYATKVGEFVSLWVSRTSMPVAFVCQVPRDHEDAAFILSMVPSECREKCHILGYANSPEMLIGLYANACALVGMRFHSLVFALLSAVPVLGLHYYDLGPKIDGLLRDIGCGELSFSIEDVDPEALVDAASGVVASRGVLSASIGKRLAKLRRRSERVLRSALALPVW